MNNRTYMVLFLVGSFFPSSLGPVNETSSSRPMFVLQLSISLILLGYCAWKYGINNKILVWVSCFIPLVLLFSTVLSFAVPFASVGLGIIGPYSAVAFLYSIRFDKLKVTQPERMLSFISCINLTVGAGMIMQNEVVGRFVTFFYSAFYADLLPRMLLERKPVLSYASHSFAGLFIYLFFWLNLRTYKATGKRAYLFFAIGHIALCIAVASHTSFAFSAAALAEIAWLAFRSRPRLAIATAIATVFLAVSFVKVDWAHTWAGSLAFWESSSGSGITGRYGEGGVQGEAIKYVETHVTPLGLINLENVNKFSIDSGPLDYMIRGSLPLVVLMYGGLWLFLRKNLTLLSDRLHLFIAILAAEIGIEAILYTRSLCLLPAFVVLLNGISEPHPKRKSTFRLRALSRNLRPVLLKGGLLPTLSWPRLRPSSNPPRA